MYWLYVIALFWKSIVLSCVLSLCSACIEQYALIIITIFRWHATFTCIRRAKFHKMFSLAYSKRESHNFIYCCMSEWGTWHKKKLPLHDKTIRMVTAKRRMVSLNQKCTSTHVSMTMSYKTHQCIPWFSRALPGYSSDYRISDRKYDSDDVAEMS